MTEPLPNLFLIGAMRAGTTALHEALNAHPQIVMSSFKEPAFFADPDELASDSRIVSQAGYVGDRARYLTLFADAGDAVYRGESSTHYTKMPRINGVADRIAAVAPQARILYLVRDPVERTLSHYRYAVRAREEKRPLHAAVTDDSFYAAVSHYAMQLRPYLDSFAGRIRVCALEDLVRDPDREMGALFSWLGLDEAGAGAAFAQRNASPSDVAMVRGPGFLHQAGRTAGYRRIRSLLPESLLNRVRSVLLRPVSQDEMRDDAVVAYLRELHEPQVRELEHLLDREFANWLTLRPQ
ncbi:MAG: sulfotransferase [Acidimicrobiia bacterium]|nr:sulfotransferase [Acidimicrobiia bacterium]